MGSTCVAYCCGLVFGEFADTHALDHTEIGRDMVLVVEVGSSVEMNFRADGLAETDENLFGKAQPVLCRTDQQTVAIRMVVAERSVEPGHILTVSRQHLLTEGRSSL